MKLYNPEDITIQTFDDSEERKANEASLKALAKVFPYNANGSKERIEELQSKGAGIYLTTNPQDDGFSRGVEYTKRFQFLSLDLDIAKEKNHSTKEELEAAKLKLFDELKTLSLPPYGVMFTKNGLQPVWKFADPHKLESKEERIKANGEYQSMVRAVTQVLGDKSEGDSICRVIRLPGSLHLKTPTDPYKITYQEISRRECTFEEFNKAYPITESIKRKSTESFDWTKLVGMTDGAGRNDGLLRAIESALGKRIPEDVVAKIAYGINYGLFKEPLGEEEFKEVVKRAYDHIKENTGKDPWPAPLDEAAYHGIAGEFVRLIEPESESDPVALLVNFLTAFCSVVGPKPYHLIEADRHKMQIFAVLTGKSSKGRKGTSWGYITNAFFLIDPDWKNRVQSGLSSGEGVIWAVRDPIKKNEPIKENKQIVDYQEVVTDPGINDKRLLVVESEFASTLRVLNREGNTLSPVIRDAWDTGRLQSLTKNSPASAATSHISILGHITTEELLRFLSITESFNGFANRFLWICTRRSKLKPHGGKIDEELFNDLVTKLRGVVDFAKEAEAIEFDSQTYQLWEDLYSYLSEELPGLLGAVKGRAEAYVKRLACIYALLNQSSVVKLAHLRAAVALWDYVNESIDYIFQGKSGDPLAEQIIEALTKNPKSMTRTEISSYFGRNLSADQINNSIETLLKLGKIIEQTTQTAGRPRVTYTLNSLNSFNSYSSVKKRYLESLDEFITKRGFNTTTQAQNNTEFDNEINEKSPDSEPKLTGNEISLNSLPGLESYGKH